MLDILLGSGRQTMWCWESVSDRQHGCSVASGPVVAYPECTLDQGIIPGPRWVCMEPNSMNVIPVPRISCLVLEFSTSYF